MIRTSELDARNVELAELERRVRLLEERLHTPEPMSPGSMSPGSMSPGSVAAELMVPGAMVPVPMLPARPADWPATAAREWELLSVARLSLLDPAMVDPAAVEAAMIDAGVHVQLHMAADAGTTGAVRVLVDGRVAGEEVTIAGAVPATHTVAVVDGSVIAVQARRSGGDGMVRVAAVLHAR
jgi:hypothetical protein